MPPAISIPVSKKHESLIVMLFCKFTHIKCLIYTCTTAAQSKQISNSVLSAWTIATIHNIVHPPRGTKKKWQGDRKMLEGANDTDLYISEMG